MTNSLEGLKKLGEEIVASAPPLHNIKFIDRFAASFLGLPAMRRSVDLDYYQVLKEMRAYEKANRACTLLSRVSVVTLFGIYKKCLSC